MVINTIDKSDLLIKKYSSDGCDKPFGTTAPQPTAYKSEFLQRTEVGDVPNYPEHTIDMKRSKFTDNEFMRRSNYWGKGVPDRGNLFYEGRTRRTCKRVQPSLGEEIQAEYATDNDNKDIITKRSRADYRTKIRSNGKSRSFNFLSGYLQGTKTERNSVSSVKNSNSFCRSSRLLGNADKWSSLNNTKQKEPIRRARSLTPAATRRRTGKVSNCDRQHDTNNQSITNLRYQSSYFNTARPSSCAGIGSESSKCNFRSTSFRRNINSREIVISFNKNNWTETQITVLKVFLQTCSCSEALQLEGAVRCLIRERYSNLLTKESNCFVCRSETQGCGDDKKDVVIPCGFIDKSVSGPEKDDAPKTKKSNSKSTKSSSKERKKSPGKKGRKAKDSSPARSIKMGGKKSKAGQTSKLFQKKAKEEAVTAKGGTQNKQLTIQEGEPNRSVRCSWSDVITDCKTFLTNTKENRTKGNTELKDNLRNNLYDGLNKQNNKSVCPSPVSIEESDATDTDNEDNNGEAYSLHQPLQFIKDNTDCDKTSPHGLPPKQPLRVCKSSESYTLDSKTISLPHPTSPAGINSNENLINLVIPDPLNAIRDLSTQKRESAGSGIIQDNSFQLNRSMSESDISIDQLDNRNDGRFVNRKLLDINNTTQKILDKASKRIQEVESFLDPKDNNREKFFIEQYMGSENDANRTKGANDMPDSGAIPRIEGLSDSKELEREGFLINLYTKSRNDTFEVRSDNEKPESGANSKNKTSNIGELGPQNIPKVNQRTADGWRSSSNLDNINLVKNSPRANRTCNKSDSWVSYLLSHGTIVKGKDQAVKANNSKTSRSRTSNHTVVKTSSKMSSNTKSNNKDVRKKKLGPQKTNVDHDVHNISFGSCVSMTSLDTTTSSWDNVSMLHKNCNDSNKRHGSVQGLDITAESDHEDNSSRSDMELKDTNKNAIHRTIPRADNAHFDFFTDFQEINAHPVVVKCYQACSPLPKQTHYNYRTDRIVNHSNVNHV